jgi:hypothetical protein
MLWDKGKTNDKEKQKLKASKKTTRRRKRDKQPTQPTQYQQTQMSGANIDRDDVELFGDEQQEKRDNTFRVRFSQHLQLTRRQKNLQK